MKVLIVGTSFSFPYGQGAASRVFMYAKALQHAGADVRVVSLLHPQGDPGAAAEPVAGVHDGIPYEYAWGTRERHPSYLGRKLLAARAARHTLDLISTASRETRGRCVVLIYAGAAEWIVALTAMARMGGAVAVLDLCEYPSAIHLRSVKAFVLREARRTVAFSALDGIIPISTYLDQYVATTPRPPARLLVPVMVDTDLFRPASPGSRPDVRRVVYCGALGRLEEVSRAVKSFADVADDIDDAELVLIGDGPRDRVAQARALVRDLGLEERVRFAGDVKREELPRLFATAEVFVLPRPAGVSSIAGLPNKLGEYLAAGRPVIVNANGDVPRYLDDGVHAYVVDPNDEAAFATRLRCVLEHRGEAAAVGLRGREVAVTEFDYRRHGERLVEFLSYLIARRAERSGR